MNNKSMKLDDGRYVYYSWDDSLHKDVPHYLIPGENGVTKDLIVTLAGFDHEVALAARYDREKEDYDYINYLVKAEHGEAQTLNPLDVLAWKRWCAAPTPKEYADQVDVVRNLMGRLTADQVDLIYEIFGEQHTQKEIADRQGKSPQAINNRLNKIKARIKKLLTEQGDKL